MDENSESTDLATIEEENPLDINSEQFAGRPLVKVEQGNYNQCQAKAKNFQCPYHAMGTRNPNDPSKWDGPCFCPRHAGGGQNLERKSLRQYQVAKWMADQIGRFADNPRLKLLHEDIAVLKMTLQAKLDSMRDLADLDMRSGGVVELVREIAKTVATCQKVEKDCGEMWDRQQILVFMQAVVNIVAHHVTSQTVLTAIANELATSTAELLKPKS